MDYNVTPTPEVKNSHKGVFKKFLGGAWEILKVVIIALIIVLPIRYFLFQPFIVKGESMVPNLQSGDYLIVDEISYRFVNPQRGDVVVLKYPLDATQRFIKRVVGLPGETVDISNGKVTITKDGKSFALNEKKYLPNLVVTDGDVHVVLGDDKYFVLGDNRPFSYDSRRWGVLPKDDIIGKALLRLLPLPKISVITSPSY
jgi:signal peptidase I